MGAWRIGTTGAQVTSAGLVFTTFMTILYVMNRYVSQPWTWFQRQQGVLRVIVGLNMLLLAGGSVATFVWRDRVDNRISTSVGRWTGKSTSPYSTPPIRFGVWTDGAGRPRRLTEVIRPRQGYRSESSWS